MTAATALFFLEKLFFLDAANTAVLLLHLLQTVTWFGTYRIVLDLWTAAYLGCFGDFDGLDQITFEGLNWFSRLDLRFLGQWRRFGFLFDDGHFLFGDRGDIGRCIGTAEKTGYAGKCVFLWWLGYFWFGRLDLFSWGLGNGGYFRLGLPEGCFNFAGIDLLYVGEWGESFKFGDDLFGLGFDSFLQDIIFIVLLGNLIDSDQFLQLGQQASVLCVDLAKFVHAG